MPTPEDRPVHHTGSKVPLKRIYTPDDISALDYETALGDAGMEPFTRGAYPEMYREKLWRIQQVSGHGNAEDQRERLKYLIANGDSVVVPCPDTSIGCYLHDADDPEVACRLEDVGMCGAPLSSLRDYETLFDGIPIERVYSSLVGPASSTPFQLGCFFSLAESRNIAWKDLHGTFQNDLLPFYLSGLPQYEIPPRHGQRLSCDVIEFCVEHAPYWMPVSFSARNVREGGINAYQEIAIGFANAISFVDEILRRGRLKIDDFGNVMGAFFFQADRDLFEEVAKFRAARRMWARLMRDRYKAQDPRSLRLRIHVQTSGAALTYQQPLNNIVRVAFQVLAAALGGVQSVHACSYDEAFGAPAEEAALVAVRTQQIVQSETNIANVVDPLGGSYYVESLTNEIEQRAWGYLSQIEERGGFISALESGWLHREMMKAMIAHEHAVASGDVKVVGVNMLQMQDEPYKVRTFRPNPKAGELQKARLEQLRRERDHHAVQAAISELRQVAESEENIVPAMLKAAKAFVTLGEVGKVYREVFSTWNPPITI